MHQLVEQLLIGIQLGSIYALIALGYTMVYGVLKLINFAHGDVYMVGAYAGLGAAGVLGTWLPGHLPFHKMLPSPFGAVLVLLAAMLLCALLGLVIEQAAYRPLRTRSWIVPGIVIGGASGYVAYGIAVNGNRTPGSAIAIGIVVWIALAALLRTTQTRRTLGNPSRLTALITAIGVSLFLENFGVLPQIFSSDQRFIQTNQIVKLPHPVVIPKISFRIFHRHVYFAALSISIETLTILGLSLILMALLTYIVTYTRIGKAVRAVSFDADAAALMGINTNTVIAFTFALGAALAGAAGVMVTGLSGTAFTPYVGVLMGLKAFVAAVLGGIGNIPGAVVGGLIMGLAETIVVAYGPSVGIPSTYRDAVAFFLLIVILLVRPAGLFGRLTPEKV
jgi:branched-chain amino acid transport system permease protein